MSEKDTISLFSGAVQITYPTFEQPALSIPYFGAIKIPLGKFFITSLFYLGILSSTYVLSKMLFSASSWVWSYLKSTFNAKKYLSSQLESLGDPNKRYYAVIYGTNKAASAYAHYLASKGFHLVIIGRTEQPLNDLEIALKHQMKHACPKVVKLVLTKYDPDTLAKVL